jgi:hypothetical protein
VECQPIQDRERFADHLALPHALDTSVLVDSAPGTDPGFSIMGKSNGAPDSHASSATSLLICGPPGTVSVDALAA